MPVQVLTDSFFVLLNHWQLVAGIVVMMVLSQSLIASGLALIFRGRLAPAEYFALSATGWILPLSLASVLWLAWGSTRGAASTLPLFFAMAALAIVLLLRARRESAQVSSAILWILVALFVAFLFLRLAFVSKVILPLYFDSAQHYLIIRNLLSSETGWTGGVYYHIGFHLLTAFSASTLEAEILDTILILGQMIVAAIPLSILLIIRQETHSDLAALFAVLLAAVGWYMPAYAVNWGKYPAVTSLPLLTFTVSLAYLAVRYRNDLSRKSYLWLSLILVFAVAITVISHSRALVVLGMIALAWVIAASWERGSKLLRGSSFFVILAGIILIILFIRTRAVFGLLFDPYWEKGSFITAIVFFLGIFASWRYPKLTLASLLVILFLLGGLLIPVRVPGYGNLTLLDRPFVEMILYLPLSFLGGAGMAGLEKSVRSLRERWQAGYLRFASYLTLIFIGVLLVNAFLHYNLYPAGCCSIVGTDDLVAIDWVEQNLPTQARILISSTELRVLDTNTPQGAAGGDAGIWITPLTGRPTFTFPYQSDFSQPSTLDAICRMHAEYIYVGEAGAPFNNGLLSAHPDRYKVVLSLPRTKLYQVIGCAPQ